MGARVVGVQDASDPAAAAPIFVGRFPVCNRTGAKLWHQGAPQGAPFRVRRAVELG